MLLCNKYSTVYTIAIYQVSNVMPMYIVLLVQHISVDEYNRSYSFRGKVVSGGVYHDPLSICSRFSILVNIQLLNGTYFVGIPF